MFKHRQRVNAAFAKGLMFGKAVGARDERERIIEIDNQDEIIRIKLASIDLLIVEAIEAERERIIKLLEDKISFADWIEIPTKKLIELIKGENK